MKEYLPALALAVLIGGVFIEQHLWDETVIQTSEEMKADCAQCGKPAILWKTTAGWVCEACDLENLIGKIHA